MVIILILATIGLVALDQITKYWASTVLQPVGTMPFIPGIIQFRYVENTGAAFSFFRDMPIFLTIVTSIALLILAYFLFIKKFKNKFEAFGFMLVFAGGAGNLIDRILNQFVVDFLDMQLFNFAVFNIADMCVTCGFVLILVTYIYQEIQNAKKAKNGDTDGQTSDNKKEKITESEDK